ncbi:putative sialidase [Metarhizium acridum CQMa 102]|uniref:Putative sialidase n=1 Tax=Metarhizium acridum (strain CQMa 102) TaxID=655827 RepID=E9EIX7_METAQ|nr:putative sialidase [Metarhizium acridum CQMa 102]EFY84130.1 putative sialidase [Metarhizium acridum CQMa 102]
MTLLYKALAVLLAGVTAVQGVTLGEVGQSIPDCGGLARFEKVVARLDYRDGLYRSSAPYYVNEDEDLKISQDTIRCLQKYGITHVISLNSQANSPAIRHALEQHGIVYTALPIPDYHAPSMDQVEQAWHAFRAHRASTLVWCGFGHGRTGTIITALQMHAQAERGESLEWTRWLYMVENSVERDVQYDLLDELQLRLRHGYQSQIESPTAAVAVDLAGAEQRVMEGDFDGLDCSVALGAALGSSWDFFHFKRSLPGENSECRQAQEMLLRQQCGVSDYSRPSANYFGSQGIRIFARGRQGDLIVKGWENSQWWDHWTSRGGYIASEPAAIFVQEGDVRVYARSKDNHLVESGYYAGQWQPWKDLGGEIAGAPSAIYLGDHGIRVYARGMTGRLVETAYYDGKWQAWKEIGGHIVDDPSAIWMKDEEGIRIYARNRLGQLIEKAFTNGEWQEWKTIGGQISSSPSAIYLGPGEIRVYARNHRYQLVEQSTRGGRLRAYWTNLGGNIVGSPGAMYMGADGIRVYARNAKGNLLEKGTWSGRWHGWTDLGRKECQGRKD